MTRRRHPQCAWIRRRFAWLWVLFQPVRLERAGFDLRIEFAPIEVVTDGRRKRSSAPRPLPDPMAPAEVAEALRDLGAVLDHHPSARAVWPALTLLERALRKHGEAGIGRLSSEVLHQAVLQLDDVPGDWCVPGLAILRSRAARVLRAVHGDRGADDAPERPDAVHAQEATLTAFLELDLEWEQQFRRREPPFMAAPAALPEGSRTLTT